MLEIIWFSHKSIRVSCIQDIKVEDLGQGALVSLDHNMANGVHDLISINLYLASKTQCSSQGQLLHNFSNSIMAINVARNLGILEPLHSHRLLIMTMEGLVQIFGLECTRWKLEIQLFPWHLIMIYLPDLLYLLFSFGIVSTNQ